MMARWDVLCLHVGLLLARSTVTSAGFGCGLKPTRFDKRGFVADIGSDYAALLESQSVVSLFECPNYVGRRPAFQWFIYNSVGSMCTYSTCWAMPMQFVGTSNNVFYRKGDLSIPETCSDVKETDPTATDGEYWIYPDAPTFLGCPTKIYCHDMASGPPREYVSLTVTNTGEYPGVQHLFCNDVIESITGHVTNFSKIRVDVKIMEVNKTDHTFGEGGAYGEADDCYSLGTRNCGPRGNFQINTNGTGMLVDPQQTWNGFGHQPHTPSVMRSADGVQIDLLCGGGCGGCRPDGPLKLHKNFQEVIPQEKAVSETEGSCCGQ